MEESGYVVLFVTTANSDEARQIAMSLLEQRKAACINIIPQVSSHFWWEGKLNSAQENLLIIKTKSSLLPEIIDLVKGLHSYQVPEIIALPIIGGSQDYLQWLGKSLS